MDTVKIIKDKVQSLFINSEGSHDWNHIKRVYDLSKKIQEFEGGDLELIQLSALLHDIADHKFNDHDFDAGRKKAYELIFDLTKDVHLAHKVSHIVLHVSYKGNGVQDVKLPIEGQIVRDADRLDAMGAIGIARTFTYGGYRNQPIFNELQNPKIHDNALEYATSKNHTIAHFYEKLLLLKNRMETKTGKEIAKKRHEFMIDFLNQFYADINFKAESTDFDLIGFF